MADVKITWYCDCGKELAKEELGVCQDCIDAHNREVLRSMKAIFTNVAKVALRKVLS